MVVESSSTSLNKESNENEKDVESLVLIKFNSTNITNLLENLDNTVPELRFRDLIIAKKFGSSPYDTDR